MDSGHGAFGLLTSEKLGHNLKQLDAFVSSVDEVRRNKLYVERKVEEDDITRVTVCSACIQTHHPNAASAASNLPIEHPKCASSIQEPHERTSAGVRACDAKRAA